MVIKIEVKKIPAKDLQKYKEIIEKRKPKEEKND